MTQEQTDKQEETSHVPDNQTLEETKLEEPTRKAEESITGQMQPENQPMMEHVPSPEEDELASCQEFEDYSDEELAAFANSDVSKEEVESEVRKSNRVFSWITKLVITLVVAGIALGGAAIAYRSSDSTNKIAGKWVSTDGEYMFQATKDKATLEIVNYGGSNALKMVFKGRLVADSGNRYLLEDIAIHLIIKTDEFTEEEVAAVKEAEELYEVVNESQSQLELKYTEQALAEFGATIDLDKFSFSIEDFQYGLFPQRVKMRNESFDINGITFEKM